MLMLKIQESAIKDLMNRLFKDELFDSFDVRGIEAVTITRFEISGVYDKSSLNEEEEAKEKAYYLNWGRLKPYVFNIIKGNRRPRLMKIIFSMNPEQTQAFNPNASALFLNLHFENGELIFSTGMSQKNFTLDKTLELAWEENIKEFFGVNGLQYEIEE